MACFALRHHLTSGKLSNCFRLLVALKRSVTGRSHHASNDRGDDGQLGSGSSEETERFRSWAGVYRAGNIDLSSTPSQSPVQSSDRSPALESWQAGRREARRLRSKLPRPPRRFPPALSPLTAGRTLSPDDIPKHLSGQKAIFSHAGNQGTPRPVSSKALSGQACAGLDAPKLAAVVTLAPTRDTSAELALDVGSRTESRTNLAATECALVVDSEEAADAAKYPEDTIAQARAWVRRNSFSTLPPLVKLDRCPVTPPLALPTLSFPPLDHLEA